MKITTFSRHCMMFLLIVCLIGSGFGSAFGAAASTGNNAADKDAAPADIGGHWAEKKLLEWKNKGLLQGYADGTLRPNSPITRGELITLTNRAMGFTEEAPISFSDLRSTDWAYRDIAIAVKAGYIEGGADGTIGAKRQISRQEAAVIVSRLLKLDGGSGTVKTFNDAGQIAKWAIAAVGAVAAEKLMVGDSSGSFRPKASMTRAEAIVVLDRVISSLGADGQLTYNEAGIYGPKDNVQIVKKDVIVNVPGVTLQNMKIEGNLLLAEGIGEGDVTLNNVTVPGKTTVKGGGANSIHFLNSNLATVIVDKRSGTVRIVLEGSTTIATLTVLTPATLSLEDDAVIAALILEAVTKVLGQGTIELATIHENAKTSTFAKQPLKKDGAGANPSGGTTTTPTTNPPDPSPAYGTITGKVTNPDNIGLEGATVTLSGTLTMTTTTDAAGLFSFNQVPEGSGYTIAVAKNGYNPDTVSEISVTKDVVTNVPSITLTFYVPLPQTGTVVGAVYGAANVPLAGANVTVTGTTYSAVTDSSGEFTILNVPAGNYTIAASKDTYFDGISNAFDVTNGGTAVVSVTLEPAPSLNVVENGQANAVIVVDDTKLSSIASTLAEYVNKSTGADLPILTTAQLAASGTQYDGDLRIYVGSTAPGAESTMALRLQSLNNDGFVIMPYQNSLSINGPTVPGTEFGVYEFLERYVGVRWLMPGPDGEDVPQLADLVVPYATVIDEPAAISRHFFGTEAWFTLQATADWAKNNRMHNSIEFHHYLNVLFDPQVFSNHPEYYPGGVLPTHPYAWQPCFNDDTAAAAIWRIKNFFYYFPDQDSISLGINDSDNYCAADVARANGKKNSMGALDMSDVYYPWVNKIVESVLEEYPDKYFGLLAYWNVNDPPTVKLNSHVIPYITDDRMTWLDPDLETIANHINEQWQLKADNLGWYEYLYGSPYNVPRVYEYKMAENYKYAKEHGVIGHVAEIYPNFGEGPKPWLSAKLQWNPDLDVDLMLNEWYERAVGEDAAPFLKQYYDLWENFWTDRIFETSWYLDWKNNPARFPFLKFTDQSYLIAVTKADLAESRSLLEQAVENAGTEKQKIRAKKLLRAFEFYEASALSYPRGAFDAPTNEQDAKEMLNDLKQSFDMAMERNVLITEFTGDPILNMTNTYYGGKWDGVQEGMISALEIYAGTITDPNNEFLADFQQVLTYIRSLKQFSATAVRTNASKEDILASLDFSQGPWVDAVPITEFLSMRSADPAPAETRMYLLWDDDNIYVGYENFDSDMSGMVVNEDAPGGWWRVADDSVETYITGDVAGGFTGFFTNPKAVKFIYKSLNNNISPTGAYPSGDSNWWASAEIKADRWNVIQVIPFASIGVDPSVSKTLMGFFFRNYHGQSMFMGWGGGAPWWTEDFRPVHLVEGNNLLTNPSIETGVAGQPWLATDWFVRFLGDESSTLRSSAFKRTGGFSLETSVVTPESSPFQVISITPGRYKAVLNYYVPMNSSTSGNIQFLSTIRKGDVTLDSSTSVERPVSWMPGRWVQFEYIFEIEPDYNGEVPDNLIFNINHSGFNPGEKLYIDDVSLHKLSD